MRWIDIVLPDPGKDARFDARMAEVTDALPHLLVIQQRDGLDAVTLIDHMALVGRMLFQAVIGTQPEAFHPDAGRAGAELPDLGTPRHDDLMGFHLVCHPQWQPLPWGWLHNGLGFLLEKHPVCLAGHPSLPDRHNLRPWMQRLVRATYLVGPGGDASLPAICAQLRPPAAKPPELLFVPGHADRNVRRLMFREADTINEALEAGTLRPPLALLKVPGGAVTPSDLALKSLGYQAIHYAGPTSEAAQYDASEGQWWMNRLIEEASQAPDHQVDELVGLEGEVLGVDPITSLLDDISEKFLHAPAAAASAPSPAPSGQGRSAVKGTAAWAGGHSAANWLLEDGPIEPEKIEQAGYMPPLVFSNSFCSLPHLGGRFALAGASTFIGPVVPLFSRAARRFAGYCYASLADGWCAGAAVWLAAQACRQDLGRDHPAWLSYGIQGYGSLALQYL